MKVIATPPKLVAQVHQTLLSEIAEGRLRPGSRIIQEQLAESMGVSRQPVQQALLLLRNQGVLTNAPGRGLIVAPLDADYVRSVYDIRAAIEGLAFRRAAERGADLARRLGPTLIEKGCAAVDSGDISEMIASDLAYHGFIHGLAKNALIAPLMQAQWGCTQRVMGEAMLDAGAARHTWTQHEAMLDAVIAGDGPRAEDLARQHIAEAAAIVIDRLHPARAAASTAGYALPAIDGAAAATAIGTPNSTLQRVGGSF